MSWMHASDSVSRFKPNFTIILSNIFFVTNVNFVFVFNYSTATVIWSMFGIAESQVTIEKWIFIGSVVYGRNECNDFSTQSLCSEKECLSHLLHNQNESDFIEVVAKMTSTDEFSLHSFQSLQPSGNTRMYYAIEKYFSIKMWVFLIRYWTEFLLFYEFSTSGILCSNGNFG